MSYRRQPTCSYCYNRGHNRRSCPDLRLQAQQGASKPSSERTWHEQAAIMRVTEYNTNNRACSYCAGSNHNVKTCASRKNDIENAITRTNAFRRKFIQALKENNFGIGAIVSYDGYFSDLAYPTPNEDGSPAFHYLLVKSFKEDEIVPWNNENKRVKLYSCVNAQSLNHIGGDYRYTGNINLPFEVVRSIDGECQQSYSCAKVSNISGSPVTGIEEEKFFSWESCHRVVTAIFDQKNNKKKIPSRSSLRYAGVVLD